MAQAAESLTPQAGQREPSMEEILASIRRIIEDSDTPRAPANAPGAPDRPRGEVEMFRSELAQADDESDPVAGDAEREPSPPAGEIDFDDSVLLGDDFVAANTSSAPAAASALQAPEPAAAQPAPAPAETASPARAHDAAPAAPVPAAPQRSAIISDVAGRQVAAAFGELEEVFAASRRRSFDEIAEEMMRPMLQDWLDNNLPTLVEKLVREEIERIARGPAR